MRHYGIIGLPLLHSFSAKYFNEKFATLGIDAEYALYPIDKLTNERVKELMKTLNGFNVTFPYKQAIIPYLDRLDETAAAIGAVNVVHEGVGYNTDCIGFKQSIMPLLRPFDRRALVLGTGGAAKAVCYVLLQLGIVPTLVSRKAIEEALQYEQLDASALAQHTLIVNCTPLGMFPEVDTFPPIPYEQLTEQHLLYDCVYNPEETLFLRKGKAQGATICNGMNMLIGQAEAAWQIWNKD